MWPFDPPKECRECSNTRRDFRALAQDFEELQDKVNRWMQRHNARAARTGDPVATADDEAPSQGGGTPAGRVQGTTHLLRRKA